MAALNNLGLLPLVPSRPAPQANVASSVAFCPLPLLDEWNYKPGGGYVGGRLCGNWSTSDPTQSCCLPCPAQDWLYEDAAKSFATANVVAMASLILCVLLLISWMLVPAERSHRHYLDVGIVSSLAIVSLAFTLPGSSGTTQTCHDRITPYDIYSSALCGATGILFQFGSLAAGLWTLLTALWSHMRLVWGKEPGKTFLLFALSVSTMVPVTLIGLTIATSGYSYGVGSVCTVDHEHAAGLLYGWIAGLSVLGLLVLGWTCTYCVLVHLWGQAHRSGRRSLTNRGLVSRRDVQASTTSFCSQIRTVILEFLLPIEFLIAASIMWALDQRLLYAKDDTKMKTFVDCLAANDGQTHLCRNLANGILPAQEAVVFAMVLTTLIGFQTCLVHFTHPSFLHTYIQILRHPLQTLIHGHYPPLAPTSRIQRQPLTQVAILPSTSTLSDHKEYKVDQPAGSLRQIRWPSLASRMRCESAGHVLQLEDISKPLPQPLPLPSPVREEGSPFGSGSTFGPYTPTPRPEGVNPYGYDRRLSPFAGSSYNTTVRIVEQASPKTSSVAEMGRPVSPVSPIDNRKSWFRDSALFENVDILSPSAGPSRPVSPTGEKLLPAPMAVRAPTPLQRTLSKASRLVIPDVLRPGLRRGQTEELPVSPKSGRNASVVVVGMGIRPEAGRRENTDEGANPLRMNAVEPFRSRRASQA